VRWIGKEEIECLISKLAEGAKLGGVIGIPEGCSAIHVRPGHAGELDGWESYKVQQGQV